MRCALRLRSRPHVVFTVQVLYFMHYYRKQMYVCCSRTKKLGNLVPILNDTSSLERSVTVSSRVPSLESRLPLDNTIRCIIFCFVEFCGELWEKARFSSGRKKTDGDDDVALPEDIKLFKHIII